LTPTFLLVADPDGRPTLPRCDDALDLQLGGSVKEAANRPGPFAVTRLDSLSPSILAGR
jgi:hypothetical protein